MSTNRNEHLKKVLDTHDINKVEDELKKRKLL